MKNSASSESVEMYLKSLAELGGEREPVSIGRVAERMGVSPVSANEMMKRLAEQDFISHQPYKGVTLTTKGRRLANSVIRRQRLWECFLIDHLQLDWAKAYDMACDLEHATAPEVADALSAYLDHPNVCPHGNAIPDSSDAMVGLDLITLKELEIGQIGRIQSLIPESSEVLAYLSDRGIRPGVWLSIIEAAPLQGPLTIKIGEKREEVQKTTTTESTVVIGQNLAEFVLMELPP